MRETEVWVVVTRTSKLDEEERGRVDETLDVEMEEENDVWFKGKGEVVIFS